ncbi:hypothetical protein TNIN_346281 [Trichonephila inaurata madagascariensis]|uniref:Uncharacterized protein n=1 Tax=Trichonephila inaurata madagascariensis TaxID=2747483 RepID=A0A8X7CFW2_9ARAC|nr:hypothetical protein TNIN_346281 [Trichonephila inaurata madagascariensis]
MHNANTVYRQGGQWMTAHGAYGELSEPIQLVVVRAGRKSSRICAGVRPDFRTARIPCVRTLFRAQAGCGCSRSIVPSRSLPLTRPLELPDFSGQPPTCL